MALFTSPRISFAVMVKGGIVALSLALAAAVAVTASVAFGAKASAGPPVLGRSFLLKPVGGVTLVRVRGSHRFTRLLKPVDVASGSEIDATRGTLSLTEASGAGASDTATVTGGRAIITQAEAAAAPATFTLSQPLTCPAPDADLASAASKKPKGAKKRHITVSENAGHFDTRGQYVATAVEGTTWTTTDTCGASTVTVASGVVKVTNLLTNTTTTLTAGQSTSAGPAVSHYTCQSAQIQLFNNWNTGGVLDGGRPPTFSTNGNVYCLASIDTYHWNNGTGATPGSDALMSASAVTLGPFKATGTSATGGPGVSVNWSAGPPPTGQPVLIDGTYTCEDSSPQTWSQNSASAGKGFCKVFVEQAIAG
jgi:hypothetical protein